MGFRTVVMLSNDQAHQWKDDPELGKKISHAMHFPGGDKGRVSSYGQVVECTHGDCQTLAILDGYTMFRSLSSKGWVRDESRNEVALKLLKESAEKFGYRLVKKRSTPTATEE